MGNQTVAFTIALGEDSHREAETLRATFHFWHPDLPFFIIDDHAFYAITGQKEPAWLGEIICFRAAMGWFFSQHFDRVLYYDSDIFIFDEVREFLTFTEEALLTPDCPTFGIETPDFPDINSGIVSACGEIFWRVWCWILYSYWQPNEPHCFWDQFSLRLLAQSQQVQLKILAEAETRRFYNRTIILESGAWEEREGKLWRGDAQVVAYHQAGEKPRGLDYLHPTARELARYAIAHAPQRQDNFLFLWQLHGPLFHFKMADFIRKIPRRTAGEIGSHGLESTPTQYRSVAPDCWEKHRQLV